MKTDLRSTTRFLPQTVILSSSDTGISSRALASGLGSDGFANLSNCRIHSTYTVQYTQGQPIEGFVVMILECVC